MWKKRTPREKKDPLKQPPLPQAGDSILEELFELLTAKTMLWVIVAALFAACCLTQWVAWIHQEPIHPWPTTVIAGVVALAAVVKVHLAMKRARGNATVSYDGKRVLVDGLEPDRNPIEQAKAGAAHIAELLERATGRRPKVRPVVLYPGWWVERQPKGADVWVLNPKALPSFLDQEPLVFKPEEISLYSDALETHVRATTSATS